MDGLCGSAFCLFCFPVFSLGGVVDSPGYRWLVMSHLQLVTNQLPSKAQLVVMFHSLWSCQWFNTVLVWERLLYDCWLGCPEITGWPWLNLYLLPFPASNASVLNIHLQPNTPTVSQWWNTYYSECYKSDKCLHFVWPSVTFTITRLLTALVKSLLLKLVCSVVCRQLSVICFTFFHLVNLCI